MKTVTIWTMVDEHGEIEVRDWSGALYQDSDYVDKSVRIKRVRVSCINNSATKVAELLPGRNGSKIMVAPRLSLMKWWLGDKATNTLRIASHSHNKTLSLLSHTISFPVSAT